MGLNPDPIPDQLMELSQSQDTLADPLSLPSSLQISLQSAQVPAQFREIFNCFICLSQLSEPSITPCCRTLACIDCFNTWLSDSEVCPHCRSPLQTQQLVALPFMNEIAQHLNSSAKSEQCPNHPKISLAYYCRDCCIPFCADCCILPPKLHLSHQVSRIQDVYLEKSNVFTASITNLAQNLSVLEGIIRDTDCNLRDFEAEELKVLEQIEIIYRDACRSIRKQTEAKVSVLVQFRDEISGSRDKVARDLNELQNNLENTCMTKLIANPLQFSALNSFSQSLDLGKLKIPEIDLKYTNDLMPNFESALFVINEFRKMDSDKCIYSLPMHASGVSWRLKVYCRGNGELNNMHLSAFIESFEGIKDKSPYQYQIQIIKPKHPNKYTESPEAVLVREYVSVFSHGDTWGYNRLCSLEYVEQMLDNDTLTIRFSVRAITWAQRCRDLNRFMQTNGIDIGSESTGFMDTDVSEDGIDKILAELSVGDQLVDDSDVPTNTKVNTPSLTHMINYTNEESTVDLGFPCQQTAYLESLELLRFEMNQFESFVDGISDEVETFTTDLHRNQHVNHNEMLRIEEIETGIVQSFDRLAVFSEDSGDYSENEYSSVDQDDALSESDDYVSDETTQVAFTDVTF